jgi:hypothetical protein
MWKALFMLVLIVGSECMSARQRKEELTQLCSWIVKHRVLPNNVKIRFEEYITTKQMSNAAGGAIIGVALGLALLPFIAPLVAGAGLFGAAATSSGLATLGGGSIASGGLGMIGGTAVVGVGSATVGGLVSYANCAADFDNFMKSNPKSYADYINVGRHQLHATFYYDGYETKFDGPVVIYYDSLKVFDGDIYCENDCSLIGVFN